MRKSIAEHIDKYKRYAEKYEKEAALKTIQRVQGDIAKIKSKHPSLSSDRASEDSWRP